MTEPHRRPQEPKGPEGPNRWKTEHDAGIAAFSYVIGGILFWTLAGWVLDRWLGTRLFVVAGALLGMAGGIYLVILHSRHADDADGEEKSAEDSADGGASGRLGGNS